MISLATPWALSAIVLPLLVRLFIPSAAKNWVAIHSPIIDKLGSLTTANKPSGLKFSYPLLGLYLVWLGIVLAAARPQLAGEVQTLPSSARNIILAVDISGSMSEQDLTSFVQPKNRLEVVKEVVNDFITKRKNDRIGLVLFGTQAYTHVPLTFDHGTLQTLLDEATIGIAGKYTAIGDAIGLSIKSLYDTQNTAKDGMVILLTDGHNNAGKTTPITMAQLAAKLKIKIHTIGIGANQSNFGVSNFFQTNPAVDLDEKPLRKIAQITQGTFMRATDAKSLRKIYTIIDKLEPSVTPDIQAQPPIDIYYIPLSIALVIALFMAAYSNINRWLIRYKLRNNI